MSASASTPAPADPKTVRFQLITPDSPHTTARLPMRVQIYPHDATDSIVTTVKNFYGLYSSPTSSKGVSFEDEAGNTMIARYENFRDKMVVYVRVIEEPAMSPSAFATRNYHSPPALGPYGSSGSHAYQNQGQHSPPSHTYPHGDANGSPPHPTSASANNASTTSSYFAPVSSLQHFHHLQEHHGEHMHRPGSRTSRKRSLSPGVGNGDRRSTSTNSKNRSRSSRARGTANGNGGSQHSDGYGPDSMADYSSGDGAPGSNSSRMKEQQPIGNTEISLENIVEGGRRKRAKFESSELPLFAPPQMPAATSNPSVSPTRRSDHRPSLPYVLPGQNPFSGAGALHSPQHYNTHFGQGGVYATPGSDRRHTRASFGYSNAGLVGLGMGILPTPDPTVSSLSEEDKDVAMQLMRLGEISNYGRTSTSTQDDTFSGRADAASSTGATSDSESESGGDDGDDYEDVDEEAALHDASRKQQQRLDLGGASRKIYQSVESADDDSADMDYKENAPAASSVSSIPTAPAAVTSAPVTNGLMAAPKMKKVTKAAGTAASKLPRPQANKTKQPKAPKQPKANGAGGAKSKKAAAAANASANAVSASAAASAVPMSPASLPPSRKLSVSSVGSGALSAATAAAIAGMTEEDITDLSSKPRCQRCRKSKKGCDRQRPCGRCRDAGLPADQCVSEDEGNGRKGRYGRHMNIPIKKENGAAIETTPGPAAAAGAASNGMQPPPPPAIHSQSQAAHAHSHSHSHSQSQSQSHSHSHAYSQPHAHPHMQSQSAIPPPSYHAPAVMPMAQSQNQNQTQLPPIQHQHLPQPPLPSQAQAQPIKSLPSLLPPAHISSTPIIAPTIPAMMAASAEKSKKRKR